MSRLTTLRDGDMIQALEGLRPFHSRGKRVYRPEHHPAGRAAGRVTYDKKMAPIAL